MAEPSKRLLWLQLIGVCAFNIADYFLTIQAMENGCREANPIVGPMLGTFQFPLAKLIVVPLLLIFIWKMRDRMGTALATFAWVPFMGYFSLMVYYRAVIL